MNLLKTEGLILRSIPFKDYDQIMTLYTPDYGLISVVVKAARSQKRGLSSAISPLNRVDLVFKRGKQELHSCRELSALNHHLFLREKSDALRAACEFAQAIRTSQLPEKPSPELYTLLIKMIERIADSPSLSSLLAAFRLKIVRHDGLLRWNSICSGCQKNLETPHFYKGEPFCAEHCPSGGMRFAREEFELLEKLMGSRSFPEIETIPVSETLSFNVKSLFEIIYL